MRSRMTPEQLAELKEKSGAVNRLRGLAWQAIGGAGTRAEQSKALKELEQEVGRRKAAKFIEAAYQQAGARPKGLRRWIG